MGGFKMSENMYEELITIEELCNILTIGKNTAYRLLKEQEISAFRIGRIWKIPRKAVSDYIQNSSKRTAK